MQGGGVLVVVSHNPGTINKQHMIFRLFNYLLTYGERAQCLATSGGWAQGLGIYGPIWPGSFHLARSGADKFADEQVVRVLVVDCYEELI